MQSSAISDLWVHQLGEVWRDVELDPFSRPRQGDSPDQENEQHEVGEGGGDVDDLAAGVDAFEDAAVDQDPGEEERAHQFPLEAADLVQAVRPTEDTVPEGESTVLKGWYGPTSDDRACIVTHS